MLVAIAVSLALSLSAALVLVLSISLRCVPVADAAATTIGVDGEFHAPTFARTTSCRAAESAAGINSVQCVLCCI